MGYETVRCYRMRNRTDGQFHGPTFVSQRQLDRFHDWVLDTCGDKNWPKTPKITDDPGMIKMLNRLGEHYCSIDEKYLDKLKDRYLREVEGEEIGDSDDDSEEESDTEENAPEEGRTRRRGKNGRLY